MLYKQWVASPEEDCNVCICFVFIFSSNPEWRSGISDATLLSGISGLSFDSRFLSSLPFFYIVFIFYRYFHGNDLFSKFFSRSFHNTFFVVVVDTI